MVPGNFATYFVAVTGAASALIGLLFVSVTLRPETVFGAAAPARGRALAATAFTGLVNAFFLSLSALVPLTNLGGPAIVLAAISLVAVVRLQRRLATGGGQWLMLTLSVVAYLFQAWCGVALILKPSDTSAVSNLAYVVIGALAIALARAWALLQGKHVAPAAPASSPTGAAK